MKKSFQKKREKNQTLSQRREREKQSCQFIGIRLKRIIHSKFAIDYFEFAAYYDKLHHIEYRKLLDGAISSFIRCSHFP